MPFANTVLPVPSSPASTTTSPGAQDRARRALPSARVSAGDRVSCASVVTACVPAASARFTCTKSARACASAAPPLRSTADGWSVGMSTAPSRNGNSLAAQLGDARPWCRAAAWWRSCRASRRPGLDELELRLEVRAAATRSRAGAGRGCPAAGTSRRSRCRRRSRVSPMPSMRLVSSWPARPTNGSPVRSSCSPGPSPTNIRSASGSPTPNTTWVRVSASGHFVHASASRSRSANEANGSGSGGGSSKDTGHPFDCRRVRSRQWYATADRTASAVTSVTMTRRRSRCASTWPVADANAMSSG